MALVDTITRVQAKGNDIKRRLLMSPGQRCFMLKRAGETKAFTEVVELTSGWNIRWSEYRGQFVLEVAYVESDPSAPVFQNFVSQASHIACGVPVTIAQDTDALDVYITDPERRDIKPPTVDSPFWKLYLTRLGKERFIVPVVSPWVLQREISGEFVTMTQGDPIIGVSNANFTVADEGRRLTVDSGGDIVADGIIIAVNSDSEVVLDTPATGIAFFPIVRIYDPA